MKRLLVVLLLLAPVALPGFAHASPPDPAWIPGIYDLPLAPGTGSELRRPLGVSIVGGLLLSQLLTLYTTPVVYLFLERWRLRTASGWRKLGERLAGRRPLEQISGGK